MHSPRTILLYLLATASLTVAGCAVETDQASTPTTGSAQTAAEHDVVRHKLVRVRQRIQFASDTIRTSTMDKGDAVVQQVGKAGVRVRVVRVTMKNGVEVDRDLVRAFVA